MLNFPLQLKYTINPIIVILVALLMHGFEPASTDLLGYIKPDIDAGEYWRLFTGNLPHTNFIHTLLNCAGVIFIWVLHAEHFSVKSYFLILIGCCLGNSIGLYLFSDMHDYVGLSGALHGVIAYGSCKDIKGGDKTGWWLLIGLIIKVAFENIVGPSDFIKELIDSNVAVEAHLFGLVSGLLLATPVIYSWIKFGPDAKPEQKPTTDQDAQSP